MDTDTERRERINININKMANKATTHDGARVGYSRTGRRTDVDTCSLQYREALQDGGAAGSTRVFLRAARASPKTCTQGSYGAREKDRERSVRIRSDNTSSSLRARSLLPPRLPPFIGKEGSRSGINFLPTESNYLGSSYVPNSLLYTTKNVCVRRVGPRALVH